MSLYYIDIFLIGNDEFRLNLLEEVNAPGDFDNVYQNIHLICIKITHIVHIPFFHLGLDAPWTGIVYQKWYKIG